MALLTISTELFQNERLMNVIDRFADWMEPIAYGYNTVILRIQNEEIPMNDVKIDLTLITLADGVEPLVIGWGRIPN